MRCCIHSRQRQSKTSRTSCEVRALKLRNRQSRIIEAAARTSAHGFVGLTSCIDGQMKIVRHPRVHEYPSHDSAQGQGPTRAGRRECRVSVARFLQALITRVDSQHHLLFSLALEGIVPGLDTGAQRHVPLNVTRIVTTRRQTHLSFHFRSIHFRYSRNHVPLFDVIVGIISWINTTGRVLGI